MNRDNWLANKPSTRVHHAPGGKSSISFGYAEPQQLATPAPAPRNAQISKHGQAGMHHTQISKHDQAGMHQKSTALQQAPAISQIPPKPISCQATAVRNFTRACGQHTPNTPQLMNRLEVEFITKMVLDELLELNATVMTPFEAKTSIMNMLKVAKDVPKMTTANKAEIVAEQADALVDIWYYSLNCAAKKGINLSAVFSLVHAANMRKVNPATGMCIKRADGKIEKPAGWCPPNIAKEMERQASQGSFS